MEEVAAPPRGWARSRRFSDERVSRAGWRTCRAALALARLDGGDAFVFEKKAYALDVGTHAIVLRVPPRERFGDGRVAGTREGNME